MDIDRHDLWSWPTPQGSSNVIPLHVKVAEVPLPPENTIEELVGNIAAEISDWDVSEDFEKSAELRLDGEDLPPVTPESIWRHPNAHPLVLTLMLLDLYGQEYIEWDPEVLRATLERDDIHTSNAVWTKILAARVLLNSPSPWRQWEVFHWTALGLAGESPNFVYLEEPEMGHLVVAAELMRIVDPRRETSEDVDKFIAGVFQHENMPYIPPPLHFAQEELEDPQLRCGNCHAVQRDDDDVRCVSCGSTSLSKIPYAFTNLRDEVKRLFDENQGKDLEEVLESLPDDAAGNCAHWLLIHWEYADRVKSQLRSQMRMLQT